MKLRVGLIGISPGWITLMQQEGISFLAIPTPDSLVPEEYSAVVVNAMQGQNWKDSVVQYIRSGGGALMTGEVYASLFNKNVRRRKLRYILPQPDSPFSGGGLIDVNVHSVSAEGSQWCPGNDGERSIFTDEYGEGCIVVFPFDAGRLLTDPRMSLKYFYSPTGTFPYELAPSVAKGELRQLVSRALEYLHAQRGVPYCHLWYFPHNTRNVVALRIDTDYGTEREITSLVHFAEEHRVGMSWYLHTEAHRTWLQNFSQLKEHEIGLHCYEHAVLKTFGGAKADIQKALDLLENVSLKPRGFAAPFGFWNPHLGKALEELGFSYSSEFSYDYDNVPSYPVIANAFCTVLQIPVHPISIGALKRSGFSVSAMLAYYDYVIQRKSFTQRPLFFYHHPMDGHLDVLASVIERTKAIGIPTLLGDFAEWWKKRISARIDVEYNHDRMKMHGNVPADVLLRISREGKEAFVRAVPDLSLNNVRWELQRLSPPLPSDLHATRAFSMKLVLENLRMLMRRKYK